MVPLFADSSIWSEWIQLGFAGFALILVVTVVWVVKQMRAQSKEMVGVVKDIGKIISDNTVVMTLIKENGHDTQQVVRKIHELLLMWKERPCLWEDEKRRNANLVSSKVEHDG